MTVESDIHARLTEALDPDRLEIINESHLHAGHVHAGNETHFRVQVVSSEFTGKSRLDRQRRVYGILAAELAGPVHALSVTALTPEEDARQQSA